MYLVLFASIPFYMTQNTDQDNTSADLAFSDRISLRLYQFCEDTQGYIPRGRYGFLLLSIDF